MREMKSGAQGGIFLSGYFGCGNLGDDLLLSAAVTQLRVIAPGAQFLVRDSGDTAPLRGLGADVVFTGIDAILADQRYRKPYRLARFVARLVPLLRRCSWLIFAGGTVFHEQNRSRSLLVQWLICQLARLLRVRIAAIGVGVSELTSARGRWLVRHIVGMSELFLVRDEAALRQCVGAAAGLAGDLVFAWPELASMSAQQARIIPPLKGEVGEQSEPGGVGCSNLDRQSNPTRPPVASLRRSTSPDRGGTPRLLPRTIALAVCPAAFQGGAEERAVVAFSEAVRAWHLHGHRVVFLIFQKAGIVPGDAAMFEQIAARLGHDILVETRTLTALPQAILTAYRDIDMLCGMRFHGFVLAALSGIPFVGVAHDNKISEICRRFEMICLDAGAFDGSVLAHAVEASLDRRPDPAVVELSIAEARENFRALAGCMK